MDDFIVSDKEVGTSLLLSPPCIEVIVEDGENVRLFVEDGRLKATGDMDKGARVFFDEVIKCQLTVKENENG